MSERINERSLRWSLRSFHSAWNVVTTISVALGPLLPLPGTVVFQKVEFARRLAFRNTQHCSIHCFAKGRRFVKKLKRLFWPGNQRQGFCRPAKSYQCDLGKSTTSLGLRFLVFSKANDWFTSKGVCFRTETTEQETVKVTLRGPQSHRLLGSSSIPPNPHHHSLSLSPMLQTQL